jgi:hypothetical protein
VTYLHSIAVVQTVGIYVRAHAHARTHAEGWRGGREGRRGRRGTRARGGNGRRAGLGEGGSQAREQSSVGQGAEAVWLPRIRSLRSAFRVDCKHSRVRYRPSGSSFSNSSRPSLYTCVRTHTQAHRPACTHARIHPTCLYACMRVRVRLCRQIPLSHLDFL